MKKYHFLSIISLICVLFIFTQCTPEAEFDESLLIGTWEKNSNPSEKWKYKADYTGVTWDTDDDIHESEGEGEKFTWSLSKSTLTHRIEIEINNGGIPKVYTVITLANNVLEYKDNFGAKITLSKN